MAHSPFKNDTLIFIQEDDAQDGPDHVDAHRSTGYVIGPYVKQGQVVSTRYNSVSMIRTIEDVLGVDHLNLNDAYQAPMTDVFDLSQVDWTYTAVASPVLKSTTLLAGAPADWLDNDPFSPIRPASWWTEQTDGFDWTAEDRVPAALFNQILWEGLKGDAPYPTARSGLDLSGRTKSASTP